MRLAKLRPLTGRLAISSGVTLTPILADDVSMTVASPVTVTASVTPARVSATSSGLVSPTPTADLAAVRREAAHLDRHLIRAGREIGHHVAAVRICHRGRNAPVCAAVVVTVAPGSTAAVRIRDGPDDPGFGLLRRDRCSDRSAQARHHRKKCPVRR